MANSVYAAKNNNGMTTSICISKNLGVGGGGEGSSGLGCSSFRVSTDPGVVLVTGASGFLATHIIQLLMRKGYRVRGTVRDISNAVKVKPLLNLCPQFRYPLELIEADLNDPQSWDRAVQRCRYVLHLATFVPPEAVDHNDELLHSSVNGTLAVLRSCHRNRVKRVVYTSSMAAIYGDFGLRDPPDFVYTEKCWARIETTMHAYHRSKTACERAAWNFWAQLPAGAFGPILCGVPGTTSMMLRKMLGGGMPLIPRVSVPIVDVRDIALGHLRAMTYPQAAGRRIIIFSGVNPWLEDVARIMFKEFKSQGYNIPTKRCPDILLKISALFDTTAAMVKPTRGRIQHINNSQMKSILGITPIPTERTLIDMAYSLIERGFIKKTKKYHGPPSDDYSPSY